MSLGVTFILTLEHQTYLLNIFSLCKGNFFLFFSNSLLYKMLVSGICVLLKNLGCFGVFGFFFTR